MNQSLIAIALSGGVDSAVAGQLLKNAGHNLVAVTAMVWPESKCCNIQTITDARCIAEQLEIKHYLVEQQEDFRYHVIDYFVNDYLDGLTPNPCTQCNRYVRFGTMRDEAIKMIKADGVPDSDNLIIATGHYAVIEQGKNGRWLLKKGVDKKKDQSYMLYMLTQEQLARTLTPLGGFTKTQTRKLAAKHNIVVAQKPDSQDACFVNGDYKDFIRKYVEEAIKTGEFVDEKGKKIGKHKGIPFYTIGQRRGLGIAAPHPLYVKSLNRRNNTITLANAEQIKSKSCLVSHCNWIAVKQLKESIHIKAKIRYNSLEEKATVIPVGEDTVSVEFDTAQSAVTPGQAAVFYDGNIVIGGGVIQK